MKRTLSLLLLLFSCAPGRARAAVFDAVDFLPPNAGAISAMGEILLTDPTSEGVEAHGRYGINEDWNVGLIVGTGTKEKNFRMGGEGVFNVLPDWKGQLGLSLLGSAIYLRRRDGGGLLMRVGPLLHKRITGWGGLPANLHAGLLWQLEARGSRLTSGTQLVFGSDFDIAPASSTYMSAELGIRLARADSYVMLGIGMRLGDLKFEPKQEESRRSPSRAKRYQAPDLEPDYTDDDFGT